ncbi:RecB family exonuclease [Cryptosporangium phraense]|uniref:PD-(D/E)XK nuclease family protein n=1 Tax=Cryptosporangium phraense TaxID=2593070 RepID=A0A545AZG2_9ACTN|nr:PD-(D/E)XK nuclease family protein [Cryptosporangium phraense]TQS46702.1 PD-(D/E)XK nuclease family protein [Cryptosporangium phraense]
MEQLGFAGMPTRLFSCTPSKLAAFAECPRRYRMTYVDRPQPPRGAPWAHNALGATVHNVLRAWWLLPREKRTPEASRKLLNDAWISDGYRDAEQQAAAKERAVGWLEDYLRTVDPDAEPFGLERTVAMRTERLAVSGRIDRLDDRNGEPVVVDYKTGRGALSEDDAAGSQALALYALAAAKTLRRPCRRVELHHLSAGEVYSHVHTPERLERHLRRAEQTAADAVEAESKLSAGAPVDEAFPPDPGPKCGWCDFRRHCPEGQAAAPPKDPWAALPS